jgi:hypothetical protein
MLAHNLLNNLGYKIGFPKWCTKYLLVAKTHMR